MAFALEHSTRICRIADPPSCLPRGFRRLIVTSNPEVITYNFKI
jgi:hypothetical protein